MKSHLPSSVPRFKKGSEAEEKCTLRKCRRISNNGTIAKAKGIAQSLHRWQAIDTNTFTTRLVLLCRARNFSNFFSTTQETLIAWSSTLCSPNTISGPRCRQNVRITYVEIVLAYPLSLSSFAHLLLNHLLQHERYNACAFHP